MHSEDIKLRCIVINASVFIQVLKKNGENIKIQCHRFRPMFESINSFFYNSLFLFMCTKLKVICNCFNICICKSNIKNFKHAELNIIKFKRKKPKRN